MHSGGPGPGFCAYNRSVLRHGVAIVLLVAACDRGTSAGAQPAPEPAPAGQSLQEEASPKEEASPEPRGNTDATPEAKSSKGLAAVVEDTRYKVEEGRGVVWAPTPEELQAPPKGVATTSSGLQYQVLQSAGGTRKPDSNDRVEVQYVGWHTDGEEFDSSIKRGRTAKFPLDRVIKGWTEGIQLMAEGDTFRFWIPESLAYEGKPGRPAGILIFDIELVSFEDIPDPPPAPRTPADVAAPPSDATVTASGLAYKVVTPGHGKSHPSETSKVEVHYSGWTTDGKMFDSSITRGRPATFPLNRVIEGWTEGVQLMVEGEKTIFWIPEALAYKGRPGKPMGMLVFEVELLSIE